MTLIEARKIFEQALEAYRNDQPDNAIGFFSQIKMTSDDLKEIYATAQFNLGILF